MKAIKVIICICILFVIMNCAHTPVQVQFCENQKCAVLSEADSKDAAYQKLISMIKANLNKEIPLMVSPRKGGKTEKGIFVDLVFPGWGAIGFQQINSLTFTDILFRDRENRQIKVMAQADITGSRVNAVVQMPCTLTVTSSNEIIFQGIAQYGFNFYLDSFIDHFDTDKLFLASQYQLLVSGPGLKKNGWKEGYMHLAFQDAGQKTGETLAETKVRPSKPDMYKPELTYKVAVADTSGKGIFYGGEGISIRVEVENKGIGIARDVQVLLSGSKRLISYIGDRRFIGDIKSGDKEIVEFRTFLPADVPAETANMRVEIVEGKGFSPKEKKSFQMAMRPSEAAKESLEVTAKKLPQLTYTAQLRDQNNNKVLDGGEEVTLRVEVENTGEGIAKDVSIELSGQKEVIDTLGNKAQIGDIKPKQKKVHEFKGVLPMQIPSGKANVRVEIVEGKGFSPKEKKSFQMAMRPLEAAKESVEVIAAAQLPLLVYTAQLRDQDNKKVLEGGKEVTLRVEVENTGEGIANDVSIELSGQKEVIDTLGNKAQIGDIKPKQKKMHEFKGILPLQIPSGRAYVRVEIAEGKGFSPKEKKSFQMAMRPSEAAKESVEVITAQLPRLTYVAQLRDQDNKKVLEGGKEVTLLVEIENTGDGTANDVSIELSGQKEIIDTLGSRAHIGDIKPKQKKGHGFKGTLPLQIPSGNATVRIEIVEGNGYSPKEKKSFQMAMRPSETAKESVEVIAAAQLPQLVYKVQLKDQNNNKVLDGGEEITLRVEVENTGEGTAHDVSIELSGQKEIIDTLGSRAHIGDIKPKQKKVHGFRGTLPANIPSSIAMLRVRINEINGYSPAGKAFQVAMKAAETAAEQTEIISDIDVDDIPPRIKGFSNKDNYAVVIGISTYRDKMIPRVKYAGRDAETMAKYLEHLAGIPKENILIKTDTDVTKGDLEDYFESWLPRRVTGNSMVYIFYAGHGTPDPAGQDAYIVPYEGHPDSPGKLYSLKKMYGELNKLPAKQVIVMLDSCFSGAEGRSVIREGTRPLVMSVENQVLIGNKMVVIAGAKGNQMTSDYDKVKHGLFTYYLLRGIRGEADKSGSGVVNVGELYEYVKQNVTRQASLELNRDQTPDLLPGKTAGSVLSLPIARTK